MRYMRYKWVTEVHEVHEVYDKSDKGELLQRPNLYASCSKGLTYMRVAPKA